MDDTQTQANETTEEEATPCGRFFKILEAHRGERHLIVLHDYPDPDAISSAFAHQILSAHHDIETDIMYAGRISHQQNIALVRLTGVHLKSYAETHDFGRYDGAVFVDNQGTAAAEITQALEAAEVPTLIIVDHHEPQERLTPKFSDIRRIGATATIYSEYLKEGPLELDADNKTHVMLATVLMHGLIVDTKNFVTAGAEEFHAAAYLSPFRDAGLLRQIISQAQTRRGMEIIRRALENRATVESYSIAGIGYVRTEDRDAIPEAANFLLQEENVHTAIVYGIVTGDDRAEALIGSLRTSRLTTSPDEFIKSTFGQDQSGDYFGGGKNTAGAFEIPLGFLAGENTEEYRELKWQVYDKQIKQKIFAKVGIEH